MENTFEVVLKKRTLFNRVIRLPKYIKQVWRITQGSKFNERVSFIFFGIKLILR